DAGLSTARQMLKPLANAQPRTRMVESDLRIVDGRRRAKLAPQMRTRPVGVTLDEHANRVGEIVLGARQPVLQGKKVSAQILRLARNDPEQPGPPPPTLH